MNPQDPLANLHPLREPSAIGWWPMAPGWWALVILGVLAIALLCYFLIRRYRANAYRRLALAQLEDIQLRYPKSGGDQHYQQNTAREINGLLKAVALRVFPHQDIASLSGEAWLEFLNSTGSGPSGAAIFPSAFANAAYLAKLSDLDNETLFRATKAWILGHKAPA